MEAIVFIILQIFFATHRICQSVTCQSCQSFLIGFQNFRVFQYSDFTSVASTCLRKKYNILKEKINSVKDKSKIQVVDKVTGNLTTFREQDQSEKLLTSHAVKCVNRR